MNPGIDDNQAHCGLMVIDPHIMATARRVPE
jgi:hypothetical protein